MTTVPWSHRCRTKEKKRGSFEAISSFDPGIGMEGTKRQLVAIIVVGPVDERGDADLLEEMGARERDVVL